MGKDDRDRTSAGTAQLSDRGTAEQLRSLYGKVLDSKKRASLLIYHRDGAEVVPLKPGCPITVGRSSQADLTVRDPSLSRQHARVELVGDEIWLQDLGSTNGTRVNGEPATRSRVRPGDDIVIGAVPAFIHALSSMELGLYGLDSHDAFVDALEQELVRMADTGRSLAMVLVQEQKGGRGLELWSPRVRALLRSFHRMALYSPDTVEICLPDCDEPAARELCRRVVEESRPGEPRLLCGVALYPQAGGGALELLEAASQAARRATPGSPVALAASRGRRTLSPGYEGGRSATVVRSPAMRSLYATVDKVAGARVPVLILGETGTGKEVIARALHDRGPGQDAPMCCVNCGAIPAELVESTLFGHERGAFSGAVKRAAGVFETAHGGTVLLDELGELPAQAQAALLRVLETGKITRVGSPHEIPVDVRVIAATHRDLEAMCDEGLFRRDLLYRLNVVCLEVPPLRERPEELIPLAELFLDRANRANGRDVREISGDARQVLTAHLWPGNVRELKNAIERATVISDGQTIQVDDLPRGLAAARSEPEAVPAPAPAPGPAPAPAPEEPGNLKEQVKQYEAMLIRGALERCGWNTRQAAEQLGLPLRTLNHKVKQHGIVRPGGDGP